MNENIIKIDSECELNEREFQKLCGLALVGMATVIVGISYIAYKLYVKGLNFVMDKCEQHIKKKQEEES